MAFRCDGVYSFIRGCVLDFDQSQFLHVLQVSLNQIEAQVSLVHDSGFSGSSLRYFQYVCYDLNRGSVLSLAPTHLNPGFGLWALWGGYNRGLWRVVLELCSRHFGVILRR